MNLPRSLLIPQPAWDYAVRRLELQNPLTDLGIAPEIR